MKLPFQLFVGLVGIDTRRSKGHSSGGLRVLNGDGVGGRDGHNLSGVAMHAYFDNFIVNGACAAELSSSNPVVATEGIQVGAGRRCRAHRARGSGGRRSTCKWPDAQT